VTKARAKAVAAATTISTTENKAPVGTGFFLVSWISLPGWISASRFFQSFQPLSPTTGSFKRGKSVGLCLRA